MTKDVIQPIFMQLEFVPKIIKYIVIAKKRDGFYFSTRYRSEIILAVFRDAEFIRTHLRAFTRSKYLYTLVVLVAIIENFKFE